MKLEIFKSAPLMVLAGLLTISFMSGSAFAAESKGAKNFREMCSDCHGKQGQGVNLFGAPLKGSSFIKKRSRAQIAGVIRNGRKGADKQFPEHGGMPRQMHLTNTQVDTLVDYLKSEFGKR